MEKSNLTNNTNLINNPNSSGYMSIDYDYSCPNKLPCGICRLTNMQCPKHVTNGTITWDRTPTTVAYANLDDVVQMKTNDYTPDKKEIKEERQRTLFDYAREEGLD